MRSSDLLSRQIRLRHMIVAATIAHRGSIREASAVLYLTQPAASRTLAELERILGVRLFDRGPKGMTVTAAGAPLVTHMQLVTSEVGSLLRHADEIVSGRRGEVRVGTLLAGSADILPAAVFEVSRRHPGVGVAISEGTPDRLHEDLMSGQVDFVVGRVTPLASMPGVDVEPLYDDDVHVVCTSNHPRSAHRGSLADLVDDAWILPPRDTSLRHQIEAAFIRACSRTPGTVTECVAPVPLRALVLRGEHLAVVPSGIFVDDLERDALVSLQVNIEGTSVPVGIITRSGSQLPSSAHALMDALRDSARARHEA
ncbi:MAG: LysR substrate-binding domain-containing protein [Acidimicrobiaceae bacterium]|nr:LysR substrate-binding domain-containing protein [Acidimicrobiaceae bacterium]MYA14358.1 LysR family transcriptional regulator [Acidimicrobiaceae bacterium]MYE66015.1 LysR family transcriptional regulator [Acidimicrobiaceae bacterium]